MFCTRCGTELPDEANFCWKCGTSIGGTAAAPSSVDYEFCQITLLSAGSGRERWSARVGNTVIAQGHRFKRYLGFFEFRESASEKLDMTIQQAHLDLVSHLVSQGWEPFTTNSIGRVTTMRRMRVVTADVHKLGITAIEKRALGRQF